MKRIVFFDIDGTLLKAGGAGRRAFSRLIKEVFNISDSMEEVSFAGMTDRLILSQLAAKHSIMMSEQDIHRCWECFPDMLQEELVQSPAVLFKGVSETLDALSKETYLSVVTGNIRRCAHAKLASAGVMNFFKEGGYADLEEERNSIAAEALRLSKKQLKLDMPCYLIGDTPSDISAALHIGACPIGVTTGSYKRAELANAGAELILSFMNKNRLLCWMEQKEQAGSGL